MIEQTNKVLVVDDDESVRESLRELLHGEGYEVISVANGAEAVEIFCRQRDQIGLLLVDLNMPLKNGWAAVDRLLEVNPALPVLIITGQPNQCEMAEAAGVSALVEKPIDVPGLLRLIRELLGNPAESRDQGVGHQEFPFHLVRATSSAARFSWTERHITPHSNWGLNE